MPVVKKNIATIGTTCLKMTFATGCETKAAWFETDIYKNRSRNPMTVNKSNIKPA